MTGSSQVGQCGKNGGELSPVGERQCGPRGGGHNKNVGIGKKAGKHPEKLKKREGASGKGGGGAERLTLSDKRKKTDRRGGNDEALLNRVEKSIKKKVSGEEKLE